MYEEKYKEVKMYKKYKDGKMYKTIEKPKVLEHLLKA